jgi:hypothetical protein
MLAFDRRLSVIPVVLVLGGCPLEHGDNPVTIEAPQPRAATHSALVSIQDIAIANLPQAGHGLTVQAFFAPARAPDFVEPIPGTPFGCQASAYDLAEEPAPTQEDHGALEIAGLNGGAIRCEFLAERGYVCPTARGNAAAEVEPGQGASRYRLDGLSLTAADVGRYLQVSGATNPENKGAFAILAVDDARGVTLANPRAVAETFAATYTVLAGAGPTPNDLYDPFLADKSINVRLTPGGERAFEDFDVQIEPGGELSLDDASAQQISALEPDGEALELGCDGDGGECGPAAVSIIRISTTDGDTTGLSPTAMPQAKHWAVEVQCAFPDTGRVRVPAVAMALIAKAHEHAPITRIRTAFMRDGFALATNKAPKPANSAIVVAGHGVLGFSNP